MSVAMHLASGHSASAAKASRPVPVPMSAMFANRCAVLLERVERLEAAAGGRVLAGAEGEAGIDLEIDRARGSRRCVGVWTWKRPARIGWSPAWLIVTQSCFAELLDPRRRRCRGRSAGRFRRCSDG